ncbi:MAG TPA: lysophospholipid acyltransferase family protein [Thermomonas sp.]|jgi:1-acyl-sn-glycerol-3-phosphate acyltransferase|nr:lysophospholipid acyltransferase family protein [Thermomonas sp.]
MSATSPAAAPALRGLRYAYRLPLLAWHLLVHLPAILVLLAVDEVGGRKVGHAALRWWARGLLRVFGLRVERVGAPLPGGTMFVANHVSWVDIVALHSQHMMGFIAKSEIRGWPVVGWLTTHAETVFLERGNADSLVGVMEEMTRRLRSGHAVAAFPEGGTRDGSALGAFHARIFTAAVEADAPVQPVALCYGERCEAQAIVAFARGESFLGNFLRLLGEPPRPARVCFLEPILHTEHAGRRGIAQSARAQVAAAMAGVADG